MKDLFQNELYRYAALAALGLLLYLPAAFFGFSGMDDETLVSGALALLADPARLPLAFAGDAFGGAGAGYHYRPLLTLSLVWDAFLGGGSPAVFHLTNALLHSACCAALLFLLRSLGCGPRRAFAVSLLFCAHPLCAQAVAWVPGRNDLLLALFSLLAAAFFARAVSAGRRRDLTAHLVCYALALFTKESAAVLPPLLAILSFALPRGAGPSRPRLAAWWAGVTGAWLLARSLALPLPLGGGELEFFRNLPALLAYLGKALFPVGLSTMPVLADLPLWPALPALALLGAGFAAGGSARLKLAGLAWFLLFLLPGLLRVRDLFPPEFSEHRAYAALPGLAVYLCALRPPARLRGAAGPAAYLAALLLAGLTLAGLGRFGGPRAFWENAAQGSPSSVLARTKLGAAYFSGGLYAAAEEQWRAGLRLSPGNTALLGNLGSAAYAAGRPAEARELWEKALLGAPDDGRVLGNLALFWYERKDYRRAAGYVRRLKESGGRAHPAIEAAAAPYLRQSP